MKKLSFLFTFLVLLFNCASKQDIEDRNRNETELNVSEARTVYMQKLDMNPEDMDFFDSESTITKFLIISKNETNQIQIKEIEFSVYSYKDNFIKKVSSNHPRWQPNKFYISEKIKFGNGKQFYDNSNLEINFNQFVIRKTEGITLQEASEKIFQQKFTQPQTIKETILYSLTLDKDLWKKEETQWKKNSDKVVWKNQLEQGYTSSFAFSAYSPDKNTTYYSKIHNIKDYLYKKVKNPDEHFMNNVFNNKEFAMYYYLESDDLNIDSLKIKKLSESKRQELVIYKKDQSLILMKR